jgi:glyoxylase-like metal-dependent hydrolase (beta-lactamase superfamily II)
MRIYQHFSTTGFCNTYVIGKEDGSDAILIDPGQVDNDLITLIESHKFNLKTVLLTHRHESHSKGVKTLLKIYNPTIFAFASSVYDFPVIALEDRMYNKETFTELKLKFDCNGIEVEAIHLPGHCIDSIVWKIDHALFTGDTLLASKIGSTPGYMERSLLMNSIKQKLMCLNDNLLVFPGHGAPTTILCEKAFNRDINDEIASPWMKGQIRTERSNRF